MDYVLVIPARLRSTRLPGKPLVKIAGVPMIERTYKRCLQAVPNEKIIIATEDESVKEHCESIGANVAITSAECLTGTDRVAELLDTIDVDMFINVQGDEPLVNPADIQHVIEVATMGEFDIVNGFAPIVDEAQYYSRMIPKVLFSKDGNLLYMSRGPIPAHKEEKFLSAWRQICIYGFSRKALETFRSQKRKTALEEIEDIEILRFIELGHRVQMIELSDESIAVDVPEDVAKVEKALKERGLEQHAI